MTNEQLSKEEKEKVEATKKLHDDRMNNLESLVGYAGANYLKTEIPYGKSGADAGNFAFNEFLTSKKANELRNSIYGEKVKHNQEMQEQMGYNTISTPEYNVTNHELEVATLGLIQDAQMHLNLKDLGDKVKGIAPSLKEKIDLIPEEIKKINYASIAKKSKEAEDSGKEYNPTMEEQTFLGYYGAITQAYKQFAGLKLLNQSTAQGYNSVFDKYLAGYKSMKEEASKPKND
ncbi:MAG: hypothetical protein NUV46_03510 [Nanoarchaeota archaeon]|nr:hypothetical protein [Nanoarchaeota archaeon]